MNSDDTLFELEQENNNKLSGPVECLGMTFADDNARREHFINLLREKLKDPEFRKIEGFPIGADEDILNLSDPPYYTACPNPFIEEWINQNATSYISGSDSYHREPFATDVSEGKNDPIYNAHSYHTKVPHKAIMRYILHYTEPGDVVYDGFCGTGMTGVAAQMCGNKEQIESLGYTVKSDGSIVDETGKVISKLGARRAVLNDLSPAATFIAYNYNTPVDVKAFEREAKRILAEVEKECGWMYETWHVRPHSSPHPLTNASPHPLTPSPRTGEGESVISTKSEGESEIRESKTAYTSPSPILGEGRGEGSKGDGASRDGMIVPHTLTNASPHPLTPSPKTGEGETEIRESKAAYTSPSPILGEGRGEGQNNTILGEGRGEGATHLLIIAEENTNGTISEQYIKLKISPVLEQQILQMAREFRKEPTETEKTIWQALRNKNRGYKVRRQQPIGPFIVDFFIPSAKLVIEIDGSIHLSQQERDSERQMMLESSGLHFIRFTNSDVMNNVKGVLERIDKAVADNPHPLTPSPRTGEGELNNPTKGEVESEIREQKVAYPSPSPILGEGRGEGSKGEGASRDGMIVPHPLTPSPRTGEGELNNPTKGEGESVIYPSPSPILGEGRGEGSKGEGASRDGMIVPLPLTNASPHPLTPSPKTGEGESVIYPSPSPFLGEGRGEGTKGEGVSRDGMIVPLPLTNASPHPLTPSPKTGEGELNNPTKGEGESVIYPSPSPILGEGRGEGAKGEGVKGRINYTVWSDVFVCPNCSKEIIFWESAVDTSAGKVLDEFPCAHCNALLTKRRMERARVTKFDKAINQTVLQAKQVPVLINYTVNGKRAEKKPDADDLALIDKIEQSDIPYWYPTDRMPEGFNTEQPKVSHGITHSHHFYTKRNLWILSALWNTNTNNNFKIKNVIKLLISSYNLTHSTKMSRIIFKSGGTKPVLTGYQSGTLYASSIPIEKNIIESITNMKVSLFVSALSSINSSFPVKTSSATAIGNSNKLDYIFTDPPFGGNLMYSELNFLWESWLKVTTNNKSEAITNNVQKKGLPEYQELMTQCFVSYYKSLKPGRWMTVEFHNSANAVWNSIQEALEKAGFVVADIRVLDKQQGSFKQVTSASAVKQDLIISCYKPRDEFEQRFEKVKGEPEGVIEFMRQHLSMLPVAPLNKDGILEIIAERTRFLLFDRMIAYHLKHGARIPLSAAEFYELIRTEFVERDEMYFLPDQASKYDAVRVSTAVAELSLFVKDERSAVQWVREQINRNPQTLGELTPRFMQELQAMESFEKIPELRDLLKENFIVDDNDKWRVPDPQNEKDLEALRIKALLKIFEGYTRDATPLKLFRKEAVLEGFKHCWQTRQYAMIVVICERIPYKILQEVPEFVQFYDIAKDMAPEPTAQLTFNWEG